MTSHMLTMMGEARRSLGSEINREMGPPAGGCKPKRSREALPFSLRSKGAAIPHRSTASASIAAEAAALATSHFPEAIRIQSCSVMDSYHCCCRTPAASTQRCRWKTSRITCGRQADAIARSVLFGGFLRFKTTCNPRAARDWRSTRATR